MTLCSSDNHYITDISCKVFSLFLDLHCKYAPASLCQSQVHVFIIKNAFITNARLKLTKKIKQMLSNTLKLNFSHLKIINTLHPCCYPKIIGHILNNTQKNICVCMHKILMINHNENKDENEKKITQIRYK